MAIKSCGLALLLAVSFIGCQTAREHSLSAAYNEARNLLRSERDDDAWANVERNLRRLNSRIRLVLEVSPAAGRNPTGQARGKTG